MPEFCYFGAREFGAQRFWVADTIENAENAPKQYQQLHPLKAFTYRNLRAQVSFLWPSGREDVLPSYAARVWPQLPEDASFPPAELNRSRPGGWSELRALG